MQYGQWLDIWLEEYVEGKLKPKTVELYRGALKNYVRPFLAAVRLSELTPHAFQMLYNRLESVDNKYPTLKPGTIKRLHGIIHKSLEQAKKLEYIKMNPTDACELSRVDKAEPAILDRQGIEIFCKEIRGHKFESFYYVALYTGLREAELIGLTWDCVDFEKGTLKVYRQLQLIKGKYEFCSPKNRKSRQFHIAQAVLNRLKEEKRKQSVWRLKAGGAWSNDEGFVFSDEVGNHLARQTVYFNFKKIVKGMGMPEMKVHSLRHSYATTSLSTGTDIKTVQMSLGHHSAAFTLDVYGHVTQGMQKEGADKMEAFILSIEKGI